LDFLRPGASVIEALRAIQDKIRTESARWVLLIGAESEEPRRSRLIKYLIGIRRGRLSWRPRFIAIAVNALLRRQETGNEFSFLRQTTQAAPLSQSPPPSPLRR
jgi:hypothetical protein